MGMTNRMDSNLGEDIVPFNEILLEWEEIVRTEVTRHRRRLGLLSPEQQTVLESALISVAGRIFEAVLEGAESCSEVDRLKYMNAWRRQAA